MRGQGMRTEGAASEGGGSLRSVPAAPWVGQKVTDYLHFGCAKCQFGLDKGTAFCKAYVQCRAWAMAAAV